MWPEAQMRIASPARPRTSPAASDHGRGRASAITAAPATQPSGTRSLARDTEVGPPGQPPVDRGEDLLRRDRPHDAVVDPAPPPVAGSAERAPPDGDVARRPGPVAGGIRGPEDADHGHPRRAGQVQRPR